MEAIDQGGGLSSVARENGLAWGDGDDAVRHYGQPWPSRSSADILSANGSPERTSGLEPSDSTPRWGTAGAPLRSYRVTMIESPSTRTGYRRRWRRLSARAFPVSRSNSQPCHGQAKISPSRPQ